MPIYEYQCEKCNSVCEALQKFSDPPLDACPECGGSMHKIMSMNAFHLKGQGWYVTDYKGKNTSSAAPVEGGEAKAETSPKAEEKPAASASTDD